MDILSRSLLAILVSTALVACGGGGSSSSSDSIGSDQAAIDSNQLHPLAAEDFVAVKLSGSAVKGVISNGLVTVFSVDSDGSRDGVLGAGLTDAFGAFAIDIPQDYAGLVEAVISGRSDNTSPTLMTCDAAGGCGVFDSLSELDLNQNGDIDFGEQFPLSTRFEMTHVVQFNGGDEPFSVHVTPLTHLSSRFAVSMGGDLTEDSLNIARSQVADLFNLTLSFAELEALDITQLGDSESVDSDRLNYSLAAASFAGLASDGGDLGDILARLTADFTQNNGQLVQVSDSGNDVSLLQLIQNAIDLTNHIEGLEEGLDPLRNRLVQRMTLALQAQEGTLSDSVSSNTVNSDSLTQAKLFTGDLTGWSDFLDFSSSDAVAFRNQLDNVEESFASTQMLAALGAVGKYAAVFSVLPDVANNDAVLPFLCGFVDGFIGSVCSGLAEQFTLAELCDDNVQVLGVSGCDLIAPFVTIPVPTLEEDLSLTFNLLSRELVATGMVYDQTVDIAYTVPDIYSQDTVFADVSGTISNSEASLELQGMLRLDKQSGLSIRDIAENVGGNGLTGQLSVAANSSAGFTGDLAISLGTETSFALGFEGLSVEGETALVTLLGEVEGLRLNESSFVVEYGDKMFELLRGTDGSTVLRNQDGVEMEFYLDLEGDGQLGAIFQSAEQFGTVWREGVSVFIEFIDGERVDLSELFSSDS